MGQGSWWDIGVNFVTAMIGVTLIGGSLEKYILGIGNVGTPMAALGVVIGLMLLYPLWQLDLIAGGVVALAWVGLKLARPAWRSRQT